MVTEWGLGGRSRGNLGLWRPGVGGGGADAEKWEAMAPGDLKAEFLPARCKGGQAGPSSPFTVTFGKSLLSFRGPDRVPPLDSARVQVDKCCPQQSSVRDGYKRLEDQAGPRAQELPPEALSWTRVPAEQQAAVCLLHRSRPRSRGTFQPKPARRVKARGPGPSEPRCAGGAGGRAGGRCAPRVPRSCRACLAEFHQERVQLEKLLTSGWNSYCAWKRLGQSKPKFALRTPPRTAWVRPAGGARRDPPAAACAHGDGGPCPPRARGPHFCSAESRAGAADRAAREPG